MSQSTRSSLSQQSELNTTSFALPTYTEASASQQSLPTYSENTESITSNQARSTKIKSAVWSFIKGDVYQYHPRLVEERCREIEEKVREGSLPAYSESAESVTSKQARSTKIRSAVGSFIKGDVYQYHPRLVEERYREVEERVRAQAAEN